MNKNTSKPDKPMLKRLKQIVQVGLLAAASAWSQAAFNYLDEFQSLDGWHFGTDNPAVRLSASGGTCTPSSNCFLLIDNGGGSVLEPTASDMYKDFHQNVSPNTISFKIFSGNFDFSVSPTNNLSIKFAVMHGPDVGEFMRISFNADGTITINGVSQQNVVLSANTWYEFRIERTGQRAEYFLSVVGQPPNQDPIGSSVFIPEFEMVAIHYTRGTTAVPLSIRMDDLHLRTEYKLETQAVNGTIGSDIPPNSYGKYSENSVVTLTAAGSGSYQFQRWTGSRRGDENPISVAMNSDKYMEAHFVQPISRTLTVLDLDGVPGSQTFTISDGGSTTLTTQVPINRGFVSWQVVKANGQATIATPNLTSTSVTLSGGDATIRAVFEDPSLRVWIKDAAAGNDQRVEPVIKLRNTALHASLTDFAVEFYFHTECLNPPAFANPAPGSWGTPIIDDLGGGNYVARFIYTQTLQPQTEVTTPSGFALFYDVGCLDCPKWKKTNDYSLDGAKLEFKELKKNGPLLVYKVPGDPVPMFGDKGRLYRDFEWEYHPGMPPGSPINYFPPFETDPVTTERQIPNLVMSQLFSKGNLVANGSFEQGRMGWNLYEDGDAPPEFEIMSHGPSPLEHAFDGFHFARVKYEEDGLEGIYFDIDESHPAFRIIENQPVTFGAWVRGNGTPGTSISLAYHRGSSSTPEASVPMEVTGDWKFVQLTLAATDPEGPPERRRFRFSILQASLTGEFFVDGVTLMKGETYVPPQVSYAWFNTRNSKMQTRALIPAEATPFGSDPEGGRVVISNTSYDNLGRADKNFLPYSEACPAGTCNPFFDASQYIVSKANQHYALGNPEGLPNAAGYAYGKTVYEDDQLTTVRKSGKPGFFYQAEGALADGTEHTTRNYFAGVNSLSPAGIGSDLTKPSNTLNPSYSYLVAMDEDGNEGIEWKNGFGQVEKKASVLMEGGHRNFVSTEYVYDARGNLSRRIPPVSCKNRSGEQLAVPNCVDPTEYSYDQENRLIEERTPDAGRIRIYYDLMGNRRIVISEAQSAAHRMMVSVFDDFGRIKLSGEYSDPLGEFFDEGNLPKTVELNAAARNESWPEGLANFKVLSRYFYDEMPSPVPEIMADYNDAPGKDARLYPDYEVGNFQHTRGRLCAVITHQPIVEAFDAATLAKIEEVSSVAYMYDKYGHVLKTYKYNGFITSPTHKLQVLENDYDVVGRIVQTRHYDQAGLSSPSRNFFFSYNSIGQLKEIQNDGGQYLANYEYYAPTSQIKTVVLDKFGVNPITIHYEYHLHGGIKKINATRETASGAVALFDEELFYDLIPNETFDPSNPRVAKPYFNGNIAQMDYKLGTQVSTTRSMEYAYDGMNRLLDAVFFLKSGGTKTRAHTFSESIQYEDDGRVKSLRRANNVDHASGGEYHYHSIPNGTPYPTGTNRLAYVDAGMSPVSLSNRDMTGTPTSPNFGYDQDGRMISDHSRNAQLKYDFRDRPIEFFRTDVGHRYKDVMAYDEGGSRISKLSFTAANASPYELLVDEDASRDRDALLLAEGLALLGERIEPLTSAPIGVEISAVPDPNGFVSLEGLVEVAALPFSGGSAGYDISGVVPGTPEYQALVSERNQGFSLMGAIHYTGFGKEIREEVEGGGVLALKVFVDMPNGLGRYMHNSNDRLYYLKNHLGTTMVTALAGANFYRDVYDYYPFGAQSKLAASSEDKVTPTFTGKELDEATGLYYFGARYYDPDLAMWISPDPARQYFSPYIYAGNGFNPLSGTDPSGTLFGQGGASWGDVQNFIKHPVASVIADMVYEESIVATTALMKDERGGDATAPGEGNRYDAFRHAFGAILLYRALEGNLDLTLELLAGHEFGADGQNSKSFLQDIHNNAEGLKAAIDPENADVPTDELARRVLNSGVLQLRNNESGRGAEQYRAPEPEEP